MRNRLCPSGEVNPPTVRRGFRGMRTVISIEERFRSIADKHSGDRGQWLPSTALRAQSLTAHHGHPCLQRKFRLRRSMISPT
jgi:hypothetical protein